MDFILLLFIVLLIMGGYYAFWYKHNREVKDEQRRIRKDRAAKEKACRELKKKQEFEAEYQTLLDKFGTCTTNVILRWPADFYSIDSRLFVFEESQMIVLHGKEYKFSDILGFSLVDDATSETITTSTGEAKTSTGSMLGRAVVGGVLTGGLGAVAGAATARKNIETNATSQTITTHKYVIYINVNSLKNPTITIPIGKDTQKAHELANLFNVIIAKGQG